MKNIAQYAQQLIKENPNKRVFSFCYEGKIYWLKQAEKVTGFFRILKPRPLHALQKEISVLRELSDKKAAVPQLILATSHYFITEDVGLAVSEWIRDKNIDIAQKMHILYDCGKALSTLHQADLTHGRPVIRDMTWTSGNVKFIDFESGSNNADLKRKKVRDLLVFIHSLYRDPLIDNAAIELAAKGYRQTNGQVVWRASLHFIKHTRWIYYILKIFSPIARKDLAAGLKLYQFLLPQAKQVVSMNNNVLD